MIVLPEADVGGRGIEASPVGDKDLAFDKSSKQSYSSEAHATFGERVTACWGQYSVAAAIPAGTSCGKSKFIKRIKTGGTDVQ